MILSLQPCFELGWEGLRGHPTAGDHRTSPPHPANPRATKRWTGRGAGGRDVGRAPNAALVGSPAQPRQEFFRQVATASLMIRQRRRGNADGKHASRVGCLMAPPRVGQVSACGRVRPGAPSWPSPPVMPSASQAPRYGADKATKVAQPHQLRTVSSLDSSGASAGRSAPACARPSEPLYPSQPARSPRSQSR